MLMLPQPNGTPIAIPEESGVVMVPPEKPGQRPIYLHESSSMAIRLRRALARSAALALPREDDPAPPGWWLRAREDSLAEVRALWAEARARARR